MAEGRADQAVVCCWTGTGASIAANKVAGIRAALCADAETARGARRWNDANVLALSLRTTSPALLGEILDGWFEAGPSDGRGRSRERPARGRDRLAGELLALRVAHAREEEEEEGQRATAPGQRECLAGAHQRRDRRR